jgi:hypothetical protein
MIYRRLAFILVLFALTLPGSAHAQQAATPAPQVVTPRINLGAVTIEAQPFFAPSPPSSRKVEGSRPHPRHERCWNECRTQSCALVCQ